MTLEHAILGLLNYEPMTGYEIKKMIDLSINHFWPAVQSQIYKTLARMEADEWLSMETIPQEVHPPRKVYSITPKGREEFLRWLEMPQSCGETRISWLVQIFFAGQMDDEKVLCVLRHLLTEVQGRLRGYASIPEDNRDSMENDPPRDKFFWMLTVDYGVAQSISQLHWLEKVIRAVETSDYTLPTIGNAQP
jgi:PadR family transcriptional regulator, regulatory protein AphA